MKVENLQIGDWVNVFGVPKQINGVRKFQNGDEMVYYDDDNGNFIKAVTPITLTNDILEKNDFKKYTFNIDCVQYNCYEVGYETYLVQNYDEDVAYTLGSLYYDSDNGNTLISFACINHVHKLQHLMNDGVCNKKEINII